MMGKFFKDIFVYYYVYIKLFVFKLMNGKFYKFVEGYFDKGIFLKIVE